MADKGKQEHNTVSLSNLGPPKGSRKKKVRVGRGIGSKLGRTSGKGNKGQSRGAAIRGGAALKAGRCRCTGASEARVPQSVRRAIFHRQPRGTQRVPCGETVTPELLRAHGFVRRAKDPIKVLGDGELKTKLTIHAQAFSASAKKRSPRPEAHSRW